MCCGNVCCTGRDCRDQTSIRDRSYGGIRCSPRHRSTHHRTVVGVFDRNGELSCITQRGERERGIGQDDTCSDLSDRHRCRVTRRARSRRDRGRTVGY